MPQPRYKQFSFNKLQMYFMSPYVIDVNDCEGTITINQPTIGDIVEMGDDLFYQTLGIFITNTTSYRLMLWENGVDWNEISDFDLFCMLYKGINNDVAKLMFKDIDFSKFEIYSKKLGDDNTVVLYDAENKIEINEEVYQYMAQYLRCIFLMNPEEKMTNDKTLKLMYINKDRKELANREYKRQHGEGDDSVLLNSVSAVVNHPGFKYKLQELREVGVYQFYDSVRRLQIYEQTTACLKGMYSGFVDGSKLNSDDYNFMKNI